MNRKIDPDMLFLQMELIRIKDFALYAKDYTYHCSPSGISSMLEEIAELARKCSAKADVIEKRLTTKEDQS